MEAADFVFGFFWSLAFTFVIGQVTQGRRERMAKAKPEPLASTAQGSGGIENAVAVEASDDW